ncbi:MAG: hypothetical protein O3C60_05155, partial [Planctomycetota bacterium]|nr:hypothetical protein [Planctomycetota bacterium]
SPCITTSEHYPKGNLPTNSSEEADKKAKKKLDVLREKLKRLKLRLIDEKSQPDDLPEIERLIREIAATEAEIEKIKSDG